MRRLLKPALLIIALPVLYVFAAAVGAILPSGPKAQGAGDIPVYLVSGPIHYDLLIPLTPDVRAKFDVLNPGGVPVSDPRARFLVVGWGAKQFYTQAGRYRDVTARAVVRGVTGDDAVLRFDVIGDFYPSPNLRKIMLTDTQFTVMHDEIMATMVSPIPLDHPGFTASDAFFPAKGRFHIFRTCNVWVGQLLRASGLRFGRWTPLPFSVTLSLQLYTG